MLTLENILSPQTIQKIGWMLLHFIWQATALAIVLAVLLRILRRFSANLRYIVACLALLVVVALPFITMQFINVSSQPLPLTIAPATETVIVPIEPAIDIPYGRQLELNNFLRAEPVDPKSKIDFKQQAITFLEPKLPYIVTVWLLGVFALSIWHLGGWTQLQKLRKKMVKPLDASINDKLSVLANKLGIKQAVGLLESALVQIPTVVGWIKPVILLPASAMTGLTTEQLQAILAHELAHIKRFDYLVNILQTMVEILGFYHPAVWWVSHKIRVEREHCCDDMAVAICGDKINYAKALTSLEELRSTGQLAVAATGGNLFSRIRRLLGKNSSEKSLLSWIPAVTVILLLVALAIPTTLALSSNSNQDPNQAGIERMLIDGFRENRDKFKSGYISWTRTTINDGFGSFATEKYETKGSFQLWWDGDKIATRYVDESLHTGERGSQIEAEIGGNTYDGGLFSRKPDYGLYENWFEQIIRWTGPLPLDKDIAQTKTLENTQLDWVIIETETGKQIKMTFKSLEDAIYSIRYFDISRGFNQIRYETYNAQGQLRSLQTRKLQRVGDGWFPVEVDMKSFDTEQNKVTLQNHFVLDIDRCIFNNPSALPDGIFDFSTAKEHKQLNEILEKYAEGSNDYDDNMKNACDSVYNYITAVMASEDEKAAEYAHPESSIARTDDNDDMREILKGQQVQLITVFADNWNALVTSSVILGDHGRIGPMIFQLKKEILDQKVHWLIDDIDLETIDSIEEEFDYFLERNTEAKGLILEEPISTNTQTGLSDNVFKIVYDKSNELIRIYFDLNNLEADQYVEIIDTGQREFELTQVPASWIGKNQEDFPCYASYIDLEIKSNFDLNLTTQRITRGELFEHDKWDAYFTGPDTIVGDGNFSKTTLCVSTWNPDLTRFRQLVDDAIFSLVAVTIKPEVEGVQVQLQADIIKWKEGEIPKLKAEVRNNGVRELAGTVREIIVDGQLYLTSDGIRSRSFQVGPTEKYDKLEVPFDDRWYSQEAYKGLRLSPGKHTIQIISELQTGLEEPETTPVIVTSNQVEIEILPNEDKNGIIASNENLEILGIDFEPIHQGKNEVYIKIRNRTDKEQIFNANIFGTSNNHTQVVDNTEIIQPNTTNTVKLVYRLREPVNNDNTQVFMVFLNPLTQDSSQGEYFYIGRFYSGDLERSTNEVLDTVPVDQTQTQAVQEAFREIQDYIRNKEYEQAWELFTEDYQKAGFSSTAIDKGFELFKQAMAVSNSSANSIAWDKYEFLNLQPGIVSYLDGIFYLSADYNQQNWTIHFKIEDKRYKIDWISEYAPGYIRREIEQRALSAENLSDNVFKIVIPPANELIRICFDINSLEPGQYVEIKDSGKREFNLPQVTTSSIGRSGEDFPAYASYIDFEIRSNFDLNLTTQRTTRGSLLEHDRWDAYFTGPDSFIGTGTFSTTTLCVSTWRQDVFDKPPGYTVDETSLVTVTIKPDSEQDDTDQIGPPANEFIINSSVNAQAEKEREQSEKELYERLTNETDKYNNTSVQQISPAITSEPNEAQIILQANVFAINAPLSTINEFLGNQFGVENNISADLNEAQAEQFRQWAATIPGSTTVVSPRVKVPEGGSTKMNVTTLSEYLKDAEYLKDGLEIEFKPVLKEDKKLIDLSVNVNIFNEIEMSDSNNPILIRKETSPTIRISTGKYYLISLAGIFKLLPAELKNISGSYVDIDKQIFLLVKADVNEFIINSSANAQTKEVQEESEKTSDNNIVQRVYDIADLVAAKIPGNEFGGMIGGYSDGMMGGQVNIESIEAVQEIVSQLQETIEPNSWKENNEEAEGAIYPYPAARPRKLAVYNTSEVHQEIQKFLKSQREQIDNTLISIETRYLLADEEFLNEVKSDLNIELNSDIILDDKQVESLLRATQKNQDVRALIAPMVTVINNETAQFSPAQDFLSYKDPYIGLIDLQLPTITLDISCQIRPRVSDDRKNIAIVFAQIMATQDDTTVPTEHLDTVKIKSIPNRKTFAFPCTVPKPSSGEKKKVLIAFVKPTIIPPEQVSQINPGSSGMMMGGMISRDWENPPVKTSDESTYSEPQDDTDQIGPPANEFIINSSVNAQPDYIAEESTQEPGDAGETAVQIDTMFLYVSENFFRQISDSSGFAIDANTALDDLRADSLLKAAQADEGTKMLVTPRVRVWDNESAQISGTTAIPSISGYIILPNDPSQKAIPTIEYNETGVLCEITPQVISDQQEVNLELYIEITQVSGYEERTFNNKYTHMVPLFQNNSVEIAGRIPAGKTRLFDSGPLTLYEENESGLTAEQKRLLILAKPTIETVEDLRPVNMTQRVYDISDLIDKYQDANEIIDIVQQTIERDSWYVNTNQARGSIFAYPEEQPRKLAIYNTEVIHQKVEQLLKVMRPSYGQDRPPLEYPINWDEITRQTKASEIQPDQQTKILIDTMIANVSDECLEYAGLDANSLESSDTWSKYRVEDSNELNIFVIDQLVTDLLLKQIGEREDSRITSKPQLIAMESVRSSFEVITEEYYIKKSEDKIDVSEENFFSKIKEEVDKGDLELFQAGTLIKATPAVKKDNKIQLDLEVKINKFKEHRKNELPELVSLLENTSSTLIPENQTLLIVGKKFIETTSEKSKIPVLGDVPIVSGLFTNQNETTEEQSLLIFIKPTIMTHEMMIRRLQPGYQPNLD